MGRPDGQGSAAVRRLLPRGTGPADRVHPRRVGRGLRLPGGVRDAGPRRRQAVRCGVRPGGPTLPRQPPARGHVPRPVPGRQDTVDRRLRPHGPAVRGRHGGRAARPAGIEQDDGLHGPRRRLRPRRPVRGGRRRRAGRRGPGPGVEPGDRRRIAATGRPPRSGHDPRLRRRRPGAGERQHGHDGPGLGRRQVASAPPALTPAALAAHWEALGKDDVPGGVGARPGPGGRRPVDTGPDQAAGLG